jgi:hypothetical protein
LVFGALTQNRSSLEDAPPRAVAIELRVGAGFRHEKSRQTPNISKNGQSSLEITWDVRADRR